ncbi:cysteine hydrolase [Desulfosarcina sp. OttesenSCG-928-A07]|nr:cysteine hydrolase [Desulfosarcina sp. OttesenSCG-928-G17]MDL2328639.1 cysteine hydrolase [Desulfosarcina sp. OttesenSCG-928-A07]
MTEKPALIIIDMVKDTFDESHHFPITATAKKLVPPINRLIAEFRKHSWPVVFSTDAFQEDDFFFKGRMNPHSIAGSKGAEVADELDMQPEDLWLPKPRFSAFFKTDLDAWLKSRNVTLCAVGGIATQFCVLATVMDALCYEYKAVFLEDCSATWSDEAHQQVLGNYRRNPLDPLLRVMTSEKLVASLDSIP